MLELKMGQEIGGFIVKGRLGKGGMGEVFLVHDKRLEVDRALKIIALKREAEGRKLDTKETREFRERFLREARTLARLRHPHIIPVHAVDEHEGNPFLVMTHFASKDARCWLYDDHPQLDEVKLVADQIASALAYAHKEGVLHRDIKLSNLLVRTAETAGIEAASRDAAAEDGAGGAEGEDGDDGAGDDVQRVFQRADEAARAPLGIEAMLIDFGLAKSSKDPDLTCTGRNMGTYSYMAPEYVEASERGESAKHTQLTDLWAVGCVLYALTCHRMPFQDANDVELFRKIQEGEFPRVESLRCDASSEWAELIHDLMQVDPLLRIQTAGELVERLAAVRSPLDPGKPPFIPEFDVDADVEGGGAGGGDEALDEAPSLSLNPKDARPAIEQRASTSIFETAAKLAAQPRAASIGKSREMPPLDIVEGITRSSALASRKTLLSAPQPAPKPAPAAAPPARGAVSSAKQQATSSAEAATRPSEVSSVTPVLPRRGAFRPRAPRAPRAAASQALAARRLAIPLVTALAVLLAGGGVVLLTGSARAAGEVRASTYVDPEELKRRGRSDEELADVERAKRARTLPLVAPSASPSSGAAPQVRPASSDTEPALATKPATGTGRHAKGGATGRHAPSEADPFLARYGARTDFNQSSGPPLPSPIEGKPASAAAGVKVPVRVVDPIVSSPTGPVIALVTQQTRVGALVLPVGTQIHGQTSGTSGARVLVSFSFAIVDGKNVRLRGSALGSDGRAGVSGTKSLGGASDLAAGGAVGGVQGAVDALSGAIDNTILGSIIRGAGNPGAQKLARINNEDEVVATPRNSRFAIYVDGVGPS